MNNTIVTSSEKQLLKKVGKVYGKTLKVMFAFFMLALISTAVTVGTANPHVSNFTIDSGQTVTLTPFYVNDAHNYQFFFGIDATNGYYEAHHSDWNTTDGMTWHQWNDFQNSMDWKIQLVVETSQDRSFTTVEKVADFSGEINFNQVYLQQGFHRIVITNHDDIQLQITTGYSSVNLGLVAVTGAFWAIFGIIVAIFAMMVHFGIWFLVIYAIVKLAIALNEKDRAPQQQIIYPQYATPKVDNTQSHQQQDTQL